MITIPNPDPKLMAQRRAESEARQDRLMSDRDKKARVRAADPAVLYRKDQALKALAVAYLRYVEDRTDERSLRLDDAEVAARAALEEVDRFSADHLMGVTR